MAELNKKKLIGAGALLLVAVGFVVYQLVGRGGGPGKTDEIKAAEKHVADSAAKLDLKDPGPPPPPPGPPPPPTRAARKAPGT